ncbi:unnamed protein product [Heligmosomoides polygyrus]|uniref:Anti_prolifrtn domain-containing protein n=1 Tax=Heligmosomoides polygyrus TaxID=6339 RepID=A0A3P8GKD8_HELPZ|nr:unnamed protein product [Heligmosomoides polygyrus]
MYTEVKELVNFLAKYLIGKIPRRPASLFTCQLANFLICRFREHKWDLNDPTKVRIYSGCCPFERRDEAVGKDTELGQLEISEVEKLEVVEEEDDQEFQPGPGFMNAARDEHHRVIRSKVKGFTDQLIISAATEMGLCPDEVLECIPDNILLFANPGEVFYRAGENAAAVPIWTGEKGVDPDLT